MLAAPISESSSRMARSRTGLSSRRARRCRAVLPIGHWYQSNDLRGNLALISLQVPVAYACTQTILFERLGLSDVDSRILAACNGSAYFLASILGIHPIDRVRRRPLILTCAVEVDVVAEFTIGAAHYQR